MRRFFALFLVAACGDNGEVPVEPVEPEPTPIAATCNESDVAASLRALPNVKTVKPADCGPYVVGAAKCFNIEIEQPIQHGSASGPRFLQQLWLVHRGCDRPTLIADWGYSNEDFFDDELSVLYKTNALWIEHRFQGNSIPAPGEWDWTALTIENGAADMHRIVTSFRAHYGGRFVSTGASKGGITATYHKYLFPNDLDGSVPYVAPASRTPTDPSYQTYLSTYFPPCMTQLRNAQVLALSTRRTAMKQRLVQAGVDPGLEDYYIEGYVAHFDWSFWQYYGVQYCSYVPPMNPTDDQLFEFFFDGGGAFVPPASDEELSRGALYYEWLTQQGFAQQLGEHVRPHVILPTTKATMEENFREEFPDVALPAHDGRLTWAVRKWARDHADDLLLIYGQYDPWSGGAMDEPRRPTSARFFVPNATHGAQISRLHPTERTKALEHATRMFGQPPAMTMRAEAEAAAERRAQLMADRELRMSLLNRALTKH